MPFDPADAAFLDDPYPTFAALRAIAPVHEHPLLGMPVAVSHAACSEVLRGRALGRIWVDAEPAEQFPAFNLLHRNSLLEREGEPHDRLRTLVAGAFNRGHTARLEPAVAQLSAVRARVQPPGEPGFGAPPPEAAPPEPAAPTA